MVANTNGVQELDLMLLRESLWKIEKDVSIALDSVIDLEAELNHTKRSQRELEKRTSYLESALRLVKPQGGSNA
jgi:hypothetical protein